MLRSLYVLLVAIVFLLGWEGFSQGTFQLPEGEKKIKIKAQVVNNLVIIPVSINGVELSFLLDTGVKSTILFNLNADYGLNLNNKSTIWLSGAGDGEATEAIKSTQNIISIGASTAINQSLYYLPDQDANFSPRLGFPVHGIIGYELFKDFIVEIDYQRSFVRLHNREFFKERKYRNASVLPVDLIEGKPYINLKILTDQKDQIAAKLLVDSGSGDALWLFEDPEEGIAIAQNSFKDHLGLGLNGEVTGYRAKLPSIQLGNYELKDLNVAYPDAKSLNYLRGVDFRNGSLGSEILKRFTFIIDYQDERLFLKKNRNFDEPFKYDRSGLVIQHTGFDLVAHLDHRISSTQDPAEVNEGQPRSIFLETNTVSFPVLKLKPNYEIAAIREDSPGAEAGLIVGDKLIKVNGRQVANLKLQDITQYFFREEGSILRLQVDRDGMVFNCKLKLRKMLK